jgi:acyl carrier protein
MARGEAQPMNMGFKQGKARGFDFEEASDLVVRTIAEVCGVHVADKEASLASLGVDSLSLLEVMSVLESKFEIVLNENVIKEFRNVTRITNIIRDAIRISPSR